MIYKTILKIILIILFVSNLFFVALATEKKITLRGKGGAIKTDGSVPMADMLNLVDHVKQNGHIHKKNENF